MVDRRKIDVPKELVKDMRESRERLRLKKPKVYSKLMNYLQAEKEGQQTAMSLLDWAYGFECNFHCPHCCADVFRSVPNQKHLTFDEIKHMADQADNLSIFIINMIGGEPLVWNEFDEILRAVDSSRFYISVTTNGWMLTPEKAEYLAKVGVDKVGISIDSGFEYEHDRFRRKPGSYKKAIEAVINARTVGLRTMISALVLTKVFVQKVSKGYSIYQQGLTRFSVSLDLQCATVSGGWRGNFDVLIDEKDAEYLESLRAKYPLLRRDVWSVPGSIGGCPAATRSIYIIPSGDVLPCLFIHISFGNVLEEPLSVIQKRMLQVKEFREFSTLCFAGEDRFFINRYLSKTFYSKKLPLNYRSVFGYL